jgi:uncharacterized membrane protein YdjX (TVP38/TMEM64 family)
VNGRSLRHTLFVRRLGSPTWDGILRGSAVLALLAIPVVLVSPAEAGGLVAFVLATIWVNGPLAIFFPATYEPILMLMGRLYAPLLIAVLGVLGTLYVEFLNYHLYRRVLHLAAFRVVRDGRVVRLIARWFDRAPFFTVWLCSWSPLPYWAVRFLAPIARYPVHRYLLATLLGRFPRLWFFAALGAYWRIDTSALVLIAVGSILVGLLAGTVKRRSRALAASHPSSGGLP